MRPFAIGLAAILALGAFAPAAISQGKKGEEITEKARTQGMTEAPPLAQAAGVACKVTDARFIGKVDDKKAKTSTNFYEVDCETGLGFVIQAIAGAPKPSVFTCVEANAPTPDGKPSSLACKLPGNADPKSDMAPLLAAAKVQCTPEQVRGIGQTSTATFFEVQCQGSGQGYVLKTSAPADPGQPAEATDCMLYDDAETNIKCTLRDKAVRLAVIDTYAAQTAASCAVKDKKYVGQSQAGSAFFEVACNDGKGYMFKVDAGKVSQTYECSKAAMVMGGCTLTDAKEAMTEQNSLYTRLAKSAAFDCEVKQYALFPSPAGKEVVELACSNRADGGVGIFGGPGVKPQVVDCAHAPIAGYRCSFTKPETTYKLVTADLKKMGKNECDVSATRIIGKTAKGTTFMEVACADGLKGYVIEYQPEPVTAINVIGCAFTKDCKLPGNV